MSQPTPEQVEELLAECWRMDLKKGLGPARGVLVSHLRMLAAARGYDPGAAERVADRLVAERGGQRHVVHDPYRVVGNVARRLLGRSPVQREGAWIYPRD